MKLKLKHKGAGARGEGDLNVEVWWCRWRGLVSVEGVVLPVLLLNCVAQAWMSFLVHERLFSSTRTLLLCAAFHITLLFVLPHKRMNSFFIVSYDDCVCRWKRYTNGCVCC